MASPERWVTHGAEAFVAHQCQCRAWPLCFCRRAHGVSSGATASRPQGALTFSLLLPLQVHYILQEVVMGGMVLETNMNEIVAQIEAQNRLEKSEVRHCWILPRLVREDLGRGRNGCCVKLGYCGALGVFSAPSSFFP